MKRLFLYLVALLLSLQVFAADTTRVIKDLSKEWLVYNPSYRTYIPYLTSIKNTDYLNNWVSLKEYSGYSLHFNAMPNSSLFVNNRLWYENLSGNSEDVVLKLNSLGEQPKTSLITVYNPKKIFPDYEYIGYSSEAKNTLVKASLKKRSQNIAINYNIIVILFLLAVIALLKNRFPRYYRSLVGFNEVPVEDFHEQTFISNPLILFIVINSIIFTYIFLIIKEKIDIPGLAHIETLKFNSFSDIVYLCCFFMAAFLCKLIYQWFIGDLFSFLKIVKMQFYELIKVTFKFNLLLLFILFITLRYWHELPFSISSQLVLITAGIFAGVIILRILFLFVRINLHRNIYLFSYLCISEILPLLVIIKLFFK